MENDICFEDGKVGNGTLIFIWCWWTSQHFRVRNTIINDKKMSGTLMGTRYRSEVIKESASKRLTMANGIKKPDMISSKEHVEK